MTSLFRFAVDVYNDYQYERCSKTIVVVARNEKQAVRKARCLLPEKPDSGKDDDSWKFNISRIEEILINGDRNE